MRLTLASFQTRLAMIAAAGALAVGCGGNALQSPTGPSGTSGAATALSGDAGAVAASSADTFATLAKGGNGKGKHQDPEEAPPVDTPPQQHPGQGKKPAGDENPGRSHQVRIVGFVSATGAGSFTVNGVDVTVAPETVIRHGHLVLTLADIEVGDHVQVRGAMEGTVLVALEIKLEDTGHDNGNIDEVEIEGAVSALTATTGCPIVTFMIGTTTITTSAATVFDDVTCATLAASAVVEVEGLRQADGSIAATKVEAQAGPDEVEGLVFDFSGAASCPAATFKVGPTLSLATGVTTTASTTFTGVTCAALANGARVEVEGTKQADGSITAASVEID